MPIPVDFDGSTVYVPISTPDDPHCRLCNADNAELARTGEFWQELANSETGKGPLCTWCARMKAGLEKS